MWSPASPRAGGGTWASPSPPAAPVLRAVKWGGLAVCFPGPSSPLHKLTRAGGAGQSLSQMFLGMRFVYTKWDFGEPRHVPHTWRFCRFEEAKLRDVLFRLRLNCASQLLWTETVR